MEFLKKKLTKLDIDFVGKRYIAGAISLLMVIVSWAVLFGVGPNLGIDFTGGTEIHLKFEKFTVDGREVVVKAQQAAVDNKNPEVLPGHLLGALLDSDADVLNKVVAESGLDVAKVRNELAQIVGDYAKLSDSTGRRSIHYNKAIIAAERKTSAEGESHVPLEFLLLGVASGDSKAAQMLQRNQLNATTLSAAIDKVRGAGSPSVEHESAVQISEVRQALETLGLESDAVQQMGSEGDQEFKIRIQDPEFGAREVRARVEGVLAKAYGPDWIVDTEFNAEIGARLTVNYKGDQVPPAEVRKKLSNLKVANVSSGREENQVVITLPGLAQQIQENIKGAMGERSFEVLAIDAVGPKVGSELQRQGFVSIAATLGLVLLYVAFRFDIGFAPGAILALFHDVSVTVGIFVLAQLEFNLPMIGALLTIVGYSLNDTIVIYDRIRENRDRFRRKDTATLINISINETLARTLATSLTTLMAIMMFLVLGGPVIFNFAFAMLLGIIFGTYSTIFVASPMILVMEDLKPYLSRMIAVQSDGPPESDEDAVLEGLSQSEQRRRARQDEDE